MTNSMTHPEAWVILAEWTDSNATVIGPFPTSSDAEAWGNRCLDPRAMWSVELLTDPGYQETLWAHTRAAQQRVLDLAAGAR